MLRKYLILTILTGFFAGGLAFAAKRADASAFTARVSTALAAFLPGVPAEHLLSVESKTENFGSAPCVAGQKTWDGDGATNNWSEAANWSCNAVPLVSDIVIFDATSTKDATIDINTSADQFRMNAGYTGTISTAPGGTFSFGRSIATFFNSNQASGNFVCGVGSQVSFAKTTFTQTGGNFDCRNGSLVLGVGTVNINGGTFDAPTGSTILQGVSNSVGSSLNLNSSGTFNHNGGTLNAKSGCSVSGNGQPLILNNVILEAQTSANGPGSYIRVLGNMTLAPGGLMTGSNTSNWELHGNLTVGNGAPTQSRSVNFLTFAGTADQIFINTGGLNPQGTWRINKPSGQLILQSNLNDFGNLNLVSGIVNAGSFMVEIGSGNDPTGGNASSYIIGKLRRARRGAGTIHQFPVGSLNGFAPATAVFSGLTITVEAKDGIHPAMNPANSLGRFWTVSQTGDANATLTFTYLNGDVNGDENLYAAARINNGTAFLAPVNTATNVITVSGETLFGDFTAGESLAPCVTGQKTWDGEGATNNWSEAANWSCNTVPLTTDRVFFNAASHKNATIDTDVTVRSIEIDGYNGVVTNASSVLTLISNLGVFRQTSGTFNGGSGTVNFNFGNNPATAGFRLQGGTFISTSGVLNLDSGGGSVIDSGATFLHNNGTVVTLAVTSTGMNLGGTAQNITFNNLDIRTNTNLNASTTPVAGRTITVEGTLTSGANFGFQPVTVRAFGNVVVAANSVGGINDLEFLGTADQTFTNLGGVYPFQNLTINKPSGRVTANSPLALAAASEDLNLTSGTLYLASGANLTARNVNIAANGRLVNDSTVTLTIGTSVVNNGVVDLQGGGAACDETPGVDPITIISSNTTQKPWTGTGVNRLVDVSVTRMGGTGAKNVFSGTNVTGNNASWVFDSGCPTTLSISPAVPTVQAGQTQTFTAGGGFAPYAFSITTNNSGGSINPSTGAYTAGPTFGVTDTVRVTDGFGGTADATVNVVGIATKLAFTVQPQSTTAGATLPTVTVAVQDASGNTVPNAPKFVQLALIASNGAVLAGTTTGTTVNGVVNFNNLSIAAAGTYTLTASTSGLTTATSDTFSITPAAPSALAFRVQPSNSSAGAAITPPVEVAITDALGNVVTTATGNVSIALGNNPTGATLAGTLSQSAVAGVATFSDLTLDRAGDGFTLNASVAGLPSATSSGFNVTSPFVVTNTGNSGPGTLRQAILNAVATPGRELITFNIPGSGPFTIQVSTTLPTLNDVVLDATTQPGYAGVPLIEIEKNIAVGSAVTIGLTLRNAEVRGLAVGRFAFGITVIGPTLSVIRQCYVGTEPGGNSANANATGIFVRSGAVVIEDNTISGNTLEGIKFESQLPLNFDSTTAVRRNRIGTTASGLLPLPNNTGIYILPRPSAGAVAPTIIGGDSADANIIAFNTATGILNAGFRNVNIRGNVIHTNGFLGIDNKVGNFSNPEITGNDPLDVDEGPNRLQNFPVLTAALTIPAQTLGVGSVNVIGTLNSRPSTEYTLDFYGNSVCQPNGAGQGQTYLGSAQVTTDANGLIAFNESFTAGAAVGSIVTATATDADGNTSEFSACRVVSEAVFSISGRVIDNFGNPVAGLMVKTSTNKKAATNSNGEYSFGNLPGGTSLSLSPIVQGTSSPASATFSNLAANQTGVDFTVTPNVKLSGVVTTNLGGALGGVVITATGPVTQIRRSDINGRYLFSQLPAGTYQIAAAKDGFSIVPNPTTVVLDANRVANFTAGLNGFADGRFFIGANGVDSRSSDLSSFSAIFRQSGLSCSASAPAVTADGVRIFAACRKMTGSGAPFDQLWSMRADGSQVTNLSASFDTSGSINDLSFDAATGYLTYSSAIQGGTYLHLMDINDNAVPVFSVPYTRGALPAIESPSVDPASPAETRIAFVLYNHNSNGQYQIFHYDVDSQTLTQLTSDPTRKLRSKYSPSGTKILFIKEVANGAGTLWTMNADGSGEQQIGTDSNVDFATWSPAGTKIAFTTATETVMIDPNGANRQSLGERIGRFSWGRSPNFDTPVGTNVQDGFCDFQITFANVSLEGTTTVNTVSSSTLPPTGGFRIGNVAFEVTTTAVVSPPINVCFQTPANISLATFNRLSMLHGENGVMVDRTTSRDFANKLICGTVTSLSPFALGEAIDAGLPSITGVVLDDQDAPLAGVSVDLTGSGTDTTLTDSEGRFSFVNLQPGGNYNVSPKLAGYLFEDYNTDFVAVSGENTVVFTGTPQTFTISGTVGAENSLLIAGATVQLSGDVNLTTTTDANGAYSFTNLPADGNYQVTPFAPGTVLSPATELIAPLNVDANGVNFTAFVPTAADGFVSGRAMTANGAGIRKATMTITDTTTGETRSVRTGTFGLYRFDALETGRTYIVTVSAKRHRFSNDSRVISLTDSVGDADFVANSME